MNNSSIEDHSVLTFKNDLIHVFYYLAWIRAAKDPKVVKNWAKTSWSFIFTITVNKATNRIIFARSRKSPRRD